MQFIVIEGFEKLKEANKNSPLITVNVLNFDLQDLSRKYPAV